MKPMHLGVVGAALVAVRFTVGSYPTTGQDVATSPAERSEATPGSCSVQPFGATAELLGTTETRMKFTGHERDESVGLDSMLARYYSSGTSRFLSVDPVVKKRKNSRLPQRWNRYVYSLNNPIKYVDPDGLDIYNTAENPSVRQEGDRLAATPTIQALYGPGSGRDLYITWGYLADAEGHTRWSEDGKTATVQVSAEGKSIRELILITTHELGHAVEGAEDPQAHDADPDAEAKAWEAGFKLREEARNPEGAEDEQSEGEEDKETEDETDEKEQTDSQQAASPLPLRR